MSGEEVVITGMGLVLPCGTGFPKALLNWEEQKPCFAPLHGKLAYRGLHGACCEKFSTTGIIPSMVNRRLDRSTRLAWVAAKEAFESAVLAPETMGERLGMVVGSMGSGNEASEAFMRPYLEKGPEAASPMLFPNCVAIAISGNIAMGFKFKGPSATQLGRENSALIAIGQAVRWLKLGVADAILAVGTDSLYPILSEILWRSRLVCREALPEIGSGKGFLPGEGAQAFILEKRSHAKARGATILACIKAMGERSEGQKLVGGTVSAIRAQALEDAVLALCMKDRPGRWIAGSSGQGMLDEVEAPLIAKYTDWPKPKFPKRLWGEFGGSGAQLLAAALMDNLGTTLITAPANGGSQLALLLEIEDWQQIRLP